MEPDSGECRPEYTGFIRIITHWRRYVCGVLISNHRIPVVGPISLVPFFDADLNQNPVYKNQLTVNPGQVNNLNLQYPGRRASPTMSRSAPGIAGGPGMSTGLEIDVILPIVQAPFYVYYAYNPSVVREYLQPPVVMPLDSFPNAQTFNNARLRRMVRRAFLFERDTE